ncbi:MAG: STAS domain-containing protein [Bacteroidales bacterium]|nr:STAS domain-containing protein [Bacteroidales bacterium]
MDIKIVKEGSLTTAVLDGRLDTPASLEVAPQFETLSAEAAGTVVLDCSSLSYISSSGLRLFLTVRKAAAEKGGKVIVRNISDEIRTVFMMTGFLNLFEIQ